MRHILSTALVALVVGSIAGATVGALAQSPGAAEEGASPAAVSSINADRVDGRHAVGAKASPRKRAGKLVATNKAGLLPGNIVKPPWTRIRGMPAGFADGVDDEGVTGITLIREIGDTVSVAPGTETQVFVDCPAGTRVTGGGAVTGSRSMNITSSWPQADRVWGIWVTNTDASARNVTPYAVCLSVEPAGALATASEGAVPASVKKRNR